MSFSLITATRKCAKESSTVPSNESQLAGKLTREESLLARLRSMLGSFRLVSFDRTWEVRMDITMQGDRWLNIGLTD